MSYESDRSDKHQTSEVHIVNGWKIYRDKTNNSVYLIVETRSGQHLTLKTTEEALNNAINCLQTYEFDAFTLGQKI